MVAARCARSTRIVGSAREPHDGDVRTLEQPAVLRGRARRRPRRRRSSGPGASSASAQRLGLEHTERGLTVVLEDLADRASGARLDLGVAVDEVATRASASSRSPTVVLPAPINPTSTRCGHQVMATYPSRLRTTSAHESPPNLRSASFGEHERHHRLGNDAHRRHGGDVGALLERHRLFLRDDVDGLEHRPVQRRERLHVRAYDDHLARRHAALDAARLRGLAPVRAGVGIPRDRVVRDRPASPRDLEAVADLDALDRLDAHERLREQRSRACGPSARGCRARRARRRRAPRPRHRASRLPSPRPSISAIIASSAAGSKHRTADSSTALEVAGPRPLGRLRREQARSARRGTAPRRRARREAPWRARRRPTVPRSHARRPARARRGRRRTRTSACPRGRRAQAAAG